MNQISKILAIAVYGSGQYAPMHARSQQMLNDLSKVIGLKEQLVLEDNIGKKTMVATLLFQNWYNENFPDDTIIPDGKPGKVTRKLLKQELKKIKPALTDSIGIVPQNGGTPEYVHAVLSFRRQSLESR